MRVKFSPANSNFSGSYPICETCTGGQTKSPAVDQYSSIIEATF